MSEPTWEQELIIAKWGEGITLPEIIEEQERRLDAAQEGLEVRGTRIKTLMQERDDARNALMHTEQLLAGIIRTLPAEDIAALLRGDHLS